MLLNDTTKETNMTHVLRAHGLFPTAIKAVKEMQQGLCIEVQTAGGNDAMEAFEQLRDVDELKNDLDFGCCLDAEQRRLLTVACTLHKNAINLFRADAEIQKIIGNLEKIIKLIN